MNFGRDSIQTTSHLWHERKCFGTLATVAMVIFLFIFGIELINQLSSNF